MEEITVKDRLHEFISYLSISGNAFEKVVGLNKGYIANKTTKPSADILTKIHTAYPDLNINWLLFGEGDMILVPKFVSEDPMPSNVPDLSVYTELDNIKQLLQERTEALTLVQSKYIALLEKMQDSQSSHQQAHIA